MSADGVTPAGRPCATVLVLAPWQLVPPCELHFWKLPTLNTACACAGRGAHASPTIASVTMARSCCLLIGVLSVLIRSGPTCDDGSVPRALPVAIDVLEPVLHRAVV